MGSPACSGNFLKSNETTRIIITAFVCLVFGFFLGTSFPLPRLSMKSAPIYIGAKTSNLLSKAPLNASSALKRHNESSNLANDTKNSSSALLYIEPKYSNLSSQVPLNASSALKSKNKSFIPSDNKKIWVPTNPRGAERLPPGIIHSESDLYTHSLWGDPNEDLTSKPKYLVTFTVGYGQKKNIDAAVRKFSENFTILLFHYDGRTSEWDEFEWSRRAIHVSARKQTKWWYAKRFLHPDIVAPYDYIFIWDEDLGVEHFDAEEYLKLVRKYGLEISQPGLEPRRGLTWQMTIKRNNSEVHKDTKERSGRCPDPLLPPCAAFVEIMATVFSRDAWRCVWHMIQNDLVHGWGLDFTFRKCVEPAHEKIGVVDAQWIVHQGVPSLGSQGKAQNGKKPWEGVRDRCKKEWEIFLQRMVVADKDYFTALKSNSTPNFQQGKKR